MLTRSTTRRLIRTILVTVAVLAILGYVTWRSLNYARGPEITIFEPTQSTSLATSTVIIRGQTERSKNLLLNGQPLSIDEDGNFAVVSIVFSGMNILTFVAEDAFNRETKLELRLYGTLDLPTGN